MMRALLGGLLLLVSLTAEVRGEIPPLPAPVAPAVPETLGFSLSNGLQVLLIPNHANPYVEARLVPRARTPVATVGKEGLATFTAAMLTNGTVRHEEAQIADLLESMGATIAAHASLDTFEVAGSVVTLEPDHLMVFLDLYTDVVRRASFPESSLARTRDLRISALRRLAEHPGLLADAALKSMLYSTGPRGRAQGGTLDSLPQITRDDLVNYQERVLIPQHAVLAFAGDFDPVAMKSWIEDAFGDPSWGQGVCQPADRPGFCSQLCEGSVCYSNAMSSTVYRDSQLTRAAFQGIDVLVVDRDEPTLTEVHWRLGQDNPVTLTDPRWASFRLGTQVLGGDFTSRLNTVLRVQEGLTYGAHFNLSFGVNDSGPMFVSTSVAPAELRRSVDLALREIDKIARQRLPAGELESFRAKIINAFPFKFETITDTLEQFLYLQVAGVPFSWLDRYKEALSVPSGDTVHEVLKLITPHKMALVVVGNESSAGLLATYGRVRVVSVESFLRSGLTYARPAKAKKPARPGDKKRRKRRRRRR